MKFVPEWQGKEGQVKDGVRLLRQAGLSGPGGELGAIDPERLAKLQDFYLAKGIIRQKTPVDELYTNEFIQIENKGNRGGGGGARATRK